MNLTTSLRSLATALIVTTLSLAAAAADAPTQESTDHGFKSPLLTRTQVDALLATPEQIVVIDLRRPDEHAGKGAFPVFLSVQAADLEKYLAYIPRDRQIITVSNHAGRSGKAADLLASRGFRVAGAVGAEFYEKDGGKLVRIVAPPPKNPAP